MKPFWNKTLFLVEAAMDSAAAFFTVKYMQLGMEGDVPTWASWVAAVVTGLVVLTFCGSNTIEQFDKRSRNY